MTLQLSKHTEAFMEQSKTIRYFCILQFLTYGSVGLWPYGLSYFRSLGLSSSEVGLISACGTFLCLFGLPLMGILADRRRAARKLLLLTLIVLIPVQLLIPVLGETAHATITAPAVFLMLAVLAATTFFGERNIITMMDSWSGDAMDRLNLNYGTCRMFGCLCYILVSFTASALLGKHLPVWLCFVIMPAISLPMILLASGKRGAAFDTPRTNTVQKEKTSTLLRMVFRNYNYVTYLLLVLGFYAFQSIVDLDLTYLMDHVGAPHSSIGLIGGYRACCELVVMLVLSRCKKLPPLWVLLSCCGLLVAAEHLLYPTVTSLPGLIALATMTGVGGGLFFGCNASYVYKIVDPRAGSTAMSVQGVCLASMGILGSMAAGSIIDRFGLTVLTGGVGILMLTTTLLFAGSRLLLLRKNSNSAGTM